MHVLAVKENYLKDQIDLVKAGLKKEMRPPGYKREPLGIYRAEAAEEIVIKRLILKDYASWLSPSDRIFIEKQIGVLMIWGKLYDY
ncbi:hypothetical protein V5E97_37610 [Singulisphaera sp. Ch08]|uniref:Uncharacterized protein n=1 Tax=Singulisphaera sp. Ch08 TaxID=3120278 RepID=A0AAU7CH49_9BACT